MAERLDAFMARANAAYYATRNPFADFTTSPEISQAFGEVLGLWAAIVWQSMGAPGRVLLAEAGPGRGTLMADALRAIGRMVPDFARAAMLEEILHLHAIAPIRVITLAPEAASHLALIPQLVAHGLRVQVGHSKASYEQALEALQIGRAHV